MRETIGEDVILSSNYSRRRCHCLYDSTGGREYEKAWARLRLPL